MSCLYCNFHGVCHYWDEDYPDETARQGYSCDENGYCIVFVPEPDCPGYQSNDDDDWLE